MRIAIIGGGAAGFFTAINIKEKLLCSADITIFEKNNEVLSKVKLSGGGRCNCSNTFVGIKNIKQVYPRGYKILKSVFVTFDHNDTFEWFEQHGLSLKAEKDGRVFPKSDKATDVVDLFYRLIYKVEKDRQSKIFIKTNTPIYRLEQLKEFDFMVVATGGYANDKLFKDLEEKGHKTKPFIPSLFGFNIKDSQLNKLSGLVAKNVQLLLCGTKYEYGGDILITHWGVSGPAILKLSSFAAEYLYNNNYKSDLLINWTGKNYAEVEHAIKSKLIPNGNKLIKNFNPLGISNNLWEYLSKKAIKEKINNKVISINQKDINRIVNVLCSDIYSIYGRYTNKSEFVSCGGIALEGINSNLESKHINNLYFAGEALDIDAITGGFNLQAAWSTAYTVAKDIVTKIDNKVATK